MIVHCPECITVSRIDMRRAMDAVACVMKYFVAASVDRGFALPMRIGMTASMLISRPIHISSQ